MTQPEETGYIADKIVKAEKRIKAYPYDTEAWSVLIRDAQMRKMEEGRGLFERLVEQFPNAGKYWKLYIEQEVTIPFFGWPFPLSSICQTLGTWLPTDPGQFVVEVT